MCDCISTVDAELKPRGQCLDATMFGVRKMTVVLLRTDKWSFESRRNKPKRMICNHCPFCGEKYARDDSMSQASTEPAQAGDAS